MSDGVERWAIDANVILRYLVGDEEAPAAKAAAIFQSVERGERVVVCDAVTLAETVWVLSSFYGLPNDEIAQGLLPLVLADGFVMSDKPRYIRALQLFAGPVRHFGDACACAGAIEECEGRLHSFDRELSSVPGISREENLDPEAW